MALLRMKDLAALEPKALVGKLAELRRELSTEKGSVQGVGRTVNPGRIRTIRRTIARILTYAKQKKITIEKAVEATPVHLRWGVKKEVKAAEKKEMPKAPAKKEAPKAAVKKEAKPAPKNEAKPEMKKAEAPKQEEKKEAKAQPAEANAQDDISQIMGEVKKD